MRAVPAVRVSSPGALCNRRVGAPTFADLRRACNEACGAAGGVINGDIQRRSRCRPAVVSP
jgi:hypothetical protein